ncbi:uncharacterized protein N7503_001784 [Penicillium pulvis]|uniref:uncharacterized protein n=1 Tax=Penicillium pulvis TaxID=1562058 RepID=UPI002547F628|nr:uncharacterized protein N7503_001784 [Penicillium pulvis]KAJ5809566.1 hypothetical protein N7503_001784 [Penicillium pulvis]
MAGHPVSRVGRVGRTVCFFNEASRTKIAISAARELAPLLVVKEVAQSQPSLRRLSWTGLSRQVNPRHRYRHRQREKRETIQLLSFQTLEKFYRPSKN